LKRIVGIPALVALAAAACEPTSTETAVARAGDYNFTVAQVVELLGPLEELPNQPEIVAELANVWIDYTLLADASLTDPDYGSVDVSYLVEQQAQAEMVVALGDSMIRPDTAISEDALRDLFSREAPGLRVRARHILLGIPPQASQAQRDSVRSRIDELLARVRAGEDFAELARSFSQDRGSGPQGGDLGEFGLGDMVRPFEEAAFALEPGEVSEPVETPYGFHLIKVEEKIVPTFEDSAEDFRMQMQARRFQEAESVYVAGILESSGLEVVEGAGQLAMDIATDAQARLVPRVVPGQLSPRALARPLVRFEGGMLTVEDFLAYLEVRPQLVQSVAQATPAVVEDQLLTGLAEQKMFVRAARDAGLERSPEQLDSLAVEVRSGLAQSAEVLGFRAIVVPEGMTPDEAVQASVRQTLRGIVSGSLDGIPLGPLNLALRRGVRWEIIDSAVQDAVNRIEEIRGPLADTTLQAPLPAAPDSGALPADTASGA
jgi:hypothetical protein